MKFQHSTELQIAGDVLRSTVAAASGTSIVLIPAGSSTLTVVVEQYLITWAGVTTAGQVSILSSLSDPNPLIVYQTGAGSIIIPNYQQIHNIGTYGLRAQNNSAGGSYSVSTWYSVSQT
jgi:hypothetical protein